MKPPIIQLSFDLESPLSSQRFYNKLATYIGEYYEQKLPNQDYGLIKKILIRFSESGTYHVWTASKEDRILTLDYPGELSILIGKSSYEVLEAFDNLLLKSLKHHSEHLPVSGEVFEDISRQFRQSNFNYSIELQKRRSPNKKDYGAIQVDMTPEKANFLGIRLNSKGEVLSKIKLVETIPSLYAIAGIVDKTKWFSKSQFLVLSKIGVQYSVDFEKEICTVEYEGSEKKKRFSEIELKLLSPNIDLEEILDLQKAKKSLLFGE